jgi:hypothetical protein
VDSDITSERNCSIGDGELGGSMLPRDRLPCNAESRLSRRLSLIVISLSSAGLWAAGWVAVSSLVGVWLR